MIKLQDLQSEIAKSSLSVPERDSINSLLQNFGQNVLDFIYKESQKLRFDLMGDVLVEVLTKMLSAQNNIFKQDFSEAVSLLNDAPQNGRWEDGLYILPWALDIEQLIKARKITPTLSLSESLLDFELAVFEYLPK